VQKIKTFRVDYPCACGHCIHSSSISFWASCSFLTAKPDTSFCLHCKHSPQHRTASVVSFLSIPQAPLIQSVTTQALFPRISSGMFYFLRRVCPNRENPFGFILEWFLFPKGFKKQISKRQIQQGLFEYNIYRQKNKKSSKDKAANTDQRFGQ
jgi:hypothetical protein